MSDPIYVLIVEDDESNAKLLSVLLRGEGFAPDVVASAEAALEYMEQRFPHIIVMDLVLPMMGGLMLTQRLRDNERTKHIPIIAVTAFNGRDSALAAGCTAYVRKPIDTNSFAALVRTHLKALS